MPYNLPTGVKVYRPDWERSWKAFVLAIFAIAMGHLEAVVVVYLRRILDINEFAQLNTFTEVIDYLSQSGIYQIERSREMATMFMLFTVAVLAGKTLRQKFAALLWIFGIWDITYYLSLRWILDWPESFMTLDCLFLIPVPWFGPVALPVIISLLMMWWGWRWLAAPTQTGKFDAGL